MLVLNISLQYKKKYCRNKNLEINVISFHLFRISRNESAVLFELIYKLFSKVRQTLVKQFFFVRIGLIVTTSPPVGIGKIPSLLFKK